MQRSANLVGPVAFASVALLVAACTYDRDSLLPFRDASGEDANGRQDVEDPSSDARRTDASSAAGDASIEAFADLRWSQPDEDTDSHVPSDVPLSIEARVADARPDSAADSSNGGASDATIEALADLGPSAKDSARSDSLATADAAGPVEGRGTDALWSAETPAQDSSRADRAPDLADSGIRGVGGATEIGGSPGSGGVIASGGALGGGGMPGSGGTPAAGGVAGVGGSGGVGGGNPGAGGSGGAAGSSGSGVCDGSAPPNFDSQCGSCGGTVLCDGTCSVPTPPNFGASCVSLTCVCGVELLGTIDCSGSCTTTSTCNCCGLLLCL